MLLICAVALEALPAPEGHASLARGVERTDAELSRFAKVVFDAFLACGLLVPRRRSRLRPLVGAPAAKREASFAKTA
jgi:hypothetical protein